MENIGPINSKSQLRTGQEFANEILQGDDEEEEEEDYESDGEHSEYSNENPQSRELERQLSQIKQDSHSIILNLSKNTLRNVLMLVCDEGVSHYLYQSSPYSL